MFLPHSVCVCVCVKIKGDQEMLCWPKNHSPTTDASAHSSLIYFPSSPIYVGVNSDGEEGKEMKLEWALASVVGE